MRSMFLMGAAAMTLALTGCGSKDKDDEIKPELTGRWLSACEPRGPFGVVALIGEKQEMDFSIVQGDVTRTFYRYSDTDCVTGLYRQDVVSTYAVVGEAKEGAKNLNLTVHKVTVTPTGTSGAAALNEEKYCDRTDWQADTAITVTGSACNSKTFSEGHVIFDIYKKEDANLFVGKDSFFIDGTSEDLRPETLDREHPLIKQ